jgi:hypothetical protein
MKLIVALHDGRPLGDVEAVQELPDILVLDGRRLLDERGGLRDGFDGVAGDDQLVLLLLAVLAGDSLVHPDASDEFLSQEVPDLDEGAALGDGAVDGEVSVDGAHLVLVALRDALDQVLDVRADSSDGGQLLLLAEPFLDLHELLGRHVNVDGQVSERLLEGSTGSLDGDIPALDGNVDPLGHGHLLMGVQNLHLF